ncbi:hypothetical protein LOC68_11225 [Blastopirellula sp. JC732]|uniref:Ig-like domain-containing protein n=1 Tax=Blastopirellula sediminis TaxID=2894196 RepID=A0A9X1MMH0_9BACT|nr:hypothetical protein [Blastopirellula sediminis]MCC9609726.1 hypothetical protein [Blastopirellula sediminis]MCC9628970.1 hypothetical protein [Blastopirellula sediminis]
MRPFALIIFALSFTASLGSFAWGDDAVPAIEYRRLYVPVGQEKLWPRNGFIYAPVIRLSDFENAVKAIHESRGGPSDVARIRRTELVGRVTETMLEGEATFELSLANEDFGQTQQFVSFQGTNLEFSPLETLAPMSISNQTTISRPGLSDGEVGIWATQADPKFRWRAVSSESGEFSLRLPPAGSSSLRLQMGADQQVQADVGIVQEVVSEDEEKPSEWLLLPDALGQIKFRIVDRRDSNSASPVHVAQHARYDVGAASISVATRFICVSTAEPLRKFELWSDARLILTGVHLFDSQRRPQPVAWEQSPPNEGGKRRLTIRLPDNDQRLSEFEFTGVVPVESSPTRLKAPLLSVDAAMWQEGEVTIAPGDDWRITTLDARQAKQVGFDPQNEQEQTAQFVLFTPSSSIEFALTRVEPHLHFLVGNSVKIGPTKITANTTATVSLAEGETLDLEFGLLGGWNVDSLTTEPAAKAMLDRWYVDDDGKLIVRLKEPISPSQAVTINARFSRPRRESEVGYDTRKLKPMQLDGEIQADWIRVSADETIELRPSPESAELLIDPASLSEGTKLLLPGETPPSSLLFASRSPRYGDPVVLAVPKRVGYKVAIHCDVLLRDEDMKERIQIEIGGAGDFNEPILLHATEAAKELTKWRLSDGGDVVCTPLVNKGAATSKLAAYELRLPPGTRLPATLTTDITRPISDGATPILLATPQVATQTNQLDIAAPRSWRLTVGEAFPLSPIYDNKSPSEDHLQNREFRYRGVDVSRVSDELGGGPVVKIDAKPLDLAPYAELAEYRFDLRRDSVLVDADFRLIAASAGELQFGFPTGCRLLAVKLDGHPVVETSLGEGLFAVKVQGGARPQVCSIRYESTAPSFPLFRPFVLRRPTTSFAILQSTSQAVTSQLTFYTWNKSLSAHLRSMFLHGLYARSGNGAERHSMELAGSTSSIWAVDPQQIVSLGYALLGISFLTGWLVPRWRVGLLIAALGVAFAAIVLPTTLAPITAGILQGLIAGCIVRWFATSWHEVEASDSRNARSAAGMLFVLAVLLPSGSLFAQQPAAAEAKPVAYPIWIPIDADKKPTGDVYLPQPLYDYLFTASKSPIYTPLPVDVTAASWRISPPTANMPDTFSVAGLFDISSTVNGTTFAFPLSADFLAGVQSVLVDEIPLSMIDLAEKKELSVMFDDAGDHRVKIVAQLPADRTVSWETPPCLNAELRYESIASKPIAEILADGKPLPFESLSTFTSIPLGAVRKIGWAPNADSNDGRFHARQVDLLQLGQPSPTLISRLQLTPISGEIRTCRVQFDPRLRWNEVKTPGVSIEVAGNELMATFEPPVAEPVALELSFTLDQSNGIGAFDLPNVSVTDAETTQRWAAIAAPTSVEAVWRKDASSLATVTTPEFIDAWPVPIDGLRRAFDLSNESTTPAIVDVTPVPSKLFITANEYVHVGSLTSDYRLDLQIETLAGEVSSLALEMTPGWKVDDVSFISDGVVRNVVWQYDEPTSRLSLFFASPLRALAEIRIQGHFATDLAAALKVKVPRVIDAQIDSSYLHISHDPDVRLRRLPEIGPAMFDTAASEAAPPLESGQGQSFGSFRVLDPKGVMQLTVQRNNVELGGEMLLSAKGGEDGWTVRVDCRLRLKRTVPDLIEFLAPANYQLKTSSLIGFDVTQRPLGAAGVIWQLRPLRPLPDEFQLSLIADVETPNIGDLVIRPVRLLGQYPPQYVAVPRSFNSQQIVWGTRELQSVAFPDSWFAMHVPAGSQVYQSLSGSYECRVAGLLPTEETPRVVALQHDVKVAAEPNYLTTTSIYLSPEGSDFFTFRLPAGAKLLATSIEGKVVAAESDAEGAVTVPLLSRSLTQKLVVSYVYPAATPGARDLDVITFDSRTTTPTPIWRIESQHPLQCDFDPLTVVEWRTDRFTEAWRRWKRGIRDSDASAVEIAAWKKRRLQEADNAWHALAALLMEVQGEHFDPQRHFSEITSGDELTLLQSEVAKAGIEPQSTPEVWSDVLYGKADAVRLSRKPATWDFDWRRPLLLIGGLLASLLLLTLIWRQPEWLELSAAWMSRWPHALGAAAGIAWGLFLQPAFVGWIIAAVFVLAASPLRLARNGGNDSGRSFLGKLERSVSKSRR